jgi:hypothetical protein
LAELLQRRALVENARQLGQPDTGVDLIERRVAGVVTVYGLELAGDEK